MADNKTTDATQEAPGIADMQTVGEPGSPTQGRRGSAEWDAAKTPPSRFQKRKGSIYAVPSSRDGHVDNNYASKFHAKHAEKGYNSNKAAK